jgi:hypothetical protein
MAVTDAFVATVSMRKDIPAQGPTIIISAGVLEITKSRPYY